MKKEFENEEITNLKLDKTNLVPINNEFDVQDLSSKSIFQLITQKKRHIKINKQS